ncbi:MAG TPA: D-amino acid aminotransferase [Tepidisphaeraceae bacterium]
MKDSVWINGQVVPRNQAHLDIEDRGYQFADGVYEVIRVYNNKPFTLDEHLQRLECSASGIKLTVPHRERLADEIRAFITSSRLSDAYLYLQLTRGVSPRNHRFPEQQNPNVLFYIVPLPPAPIPEETDGTKLLALTDERWKRCWIKSIGLIANVLAKNEAMDAGCDEAVFINDGIVNECSTSNLFIVSNRKLITHPIGEKVLPGITRLVVLEIARSLGIEVEERGYTEVEALTADELFITSTTRELAWVSHWNDQTVGGAHCGPITMKLHQAFRDRVRAETEIAATRANRPAARNRSAA